MLPEFGCDHKLGRQGFDGIAHQQKIVEAADTAQNARLRTLLKWWVRLAGSVISFS